MMLQAQLDEIDGRLNKLMHEYRFLELNWNSEDEPIPMNDEVWDVLRVSVQTIEGDIDDSITNLFIHLGCSYTRNPKPGDDDKRNFIKQRIQLLLLGKEYPEDDDDIKELFGYGRKDLKIACVQYPTNLLAIVSRLISSNFVKIHYKPDNEGGKQFVLGFVYHHLKKQFPTFTNEAYNQLIQNIRVP